MKDWLRKLFRRFAVGSMAVLPQAAMSNPLKPEEDSNRLKMKDERFQKTVDSARLWNSLFPALTEEQRKDPNVYLMMPWYGEDHFSKMAKLTEDKWKPKDVPWDYADDESRRSIIQNTVTKKIMGRNDVLVPAQLAKLTAKQRYDYYWTGQYVEEGEQISPIPLGDFDNEKVASSISPLTPEQYNSLSSEEVLDYVLHGPEALARAGSLRPEEVEKRRINAEWAIKHIKKEGKPIE